MRNKWLSAALALSFLLGGCYDSKEMDERDFVISLGVDKGESGGFKVSLGIADGGSEKDNATGEKIKELTGEQFPAAINLFTEKESRSMYYGHTKTIVLDDGALDDEILMAGILDTILRNSQFSEKIIVLSTENGASGILKTVEENEGGDGLYIWDFYKNNSGEVVNANPLSLKDFSSEYIAGRDVIVPLISADDGVKIEGGTICSSHGVKGYLTGDEMQGAIYINGNAAGHLIEVKDTGTAEITKSRADIKFTEENGLRCSIDIDVKGKAVSIPEGSADALEAGVEESINKDVLNAIKKMRETSSDALYIAERLKRRNPDLYDKYGGSFSDIEFNININSKIVSTGVIE